MIQLLGYLDSVEIQVIMSLLKVIDNPTDDISLVTVLRSMIGGFTDNELIKIRIGRTSKSFYEAMCDYMESDDEDIELKAKVEEFLNKVDGFRKEQEYMPLDELIWKIYLDTGYYNYASLMPNGVLRASNLRMLFERAKQYEKTSFKGLYNFISFINKLRLSSKDMSSAKIIGENEDVIRIMSIHKSKGLEFPLVFLCGASREFNMRELNQDQILLHQDLGLGPKYINYEEGEGYTTLACEAIKIKSKLELVSEEMRVLYVALTRAKEKLIITGMTKDYDKEIEKKEVLLNSYEEVDENGKINKGVIQKYISYLDWIELVYLSKKKELEGIFDVHIHKKQEVLKTVLNKEEEKSIDLEERLTNIDRNKLELIKEKLEWEYINKIPNNVVTKTSVTKIKNMKLNLEEEKNVEYNIPEFLKSENELTSLEKGTLMHLLLQKLDEKIEYDEERIKVLISDLENNGIIGDRERSVIDIQKLLLFTKTKIWNELKRAKEVHKEKPFYINIPAKEIYEEDIDENILVQGIIDLYYITMEGDIVLVDYKTDRVKNENELVEKYKEQLYIYKRALEKAIRQKCKFCVYLFYIFR